MSLKDQLLSPLQFAKKIGVSTSTLRRWEKEGVLKSQRDASDRRWYSPVDIDKVIEHKKNISLLRADNSRKKIYYSQVTVATKEINPSEIHAAETGAKVTGGVSRNTENKNQELGIQDRNLQTHEINLTHYESQKQDLKPVNRAPFPVGVFSKFAFFILALFVVGGVLAFGENINYQPKAIGKELSKRTQQIAGFFHIPAANSSAAANSELEDLTFNPQDLPSVLAAETGTAPSEVLLLNISTQFNKPSYFKERINAQGQILDLSEGQIIAPNVIYDIVPGEGVLISEGQTPTISLDGVSSFQGEKGAVNLIAGTGIALDGLEVTNTDPGSAQNIIKNFNFDGENVVARSNTDTLVINAGENINIDTDPSTNEVTISSSSQQTGSGWFDAGSIVRLATSSDLVGIGTANPSSNLEVVGSTMLNGDVRIQGGLTIGGSSNVLSDSSGVASLSGIDLIDDTTESTIENAIDTLNNLASIGTVTSGVWNASTVATDFGGTGRTSFTQNGVVYGNGSNALAVTAAPSGGQILVGNVSGVPTFLTLSGDISLNTSGITSIQPDAVSLGTDTTGNYVSSVTAGSGLTGDVASEGGVAALAVGGGTGITVNADDVAINQAASLTWTGTETFSPSGANDLVINTDADSLLQVSGLASGSGTVLCVDGSNNIVTCTVASGSPFNSSAGVITKAAVSDRVALLYGDAADTQFAIENTTNTVLPTADTFQIDLTGGTTGIVTDGVDAISIAAEFGNGTTNTNSAVHIDVDPVNTPSGDEIFYGINIDGLAAGTAASESAVFIGANWDAALNLNGVLISSAELGLLDGRSGTLVDSANVASFATTALSAGSGLTGGGTVGALTVNIGTGNGITVNADDIAVNLLTSADGTGASSSNSGLEFQGVSSNQLTMLQGCADGEILKWNDSTNSWGCSTDTGATSAVVNVQQDDVTIGTNVGTLDFVTFFTVTESPSGEDNITMRSDSLNFSEFSDSLSLDADTSISAAAGLELTYNKTFTDATGENGVVYNFTAADTSSGTTSQYGLYLDNLASTEGLDASLVIDNSDTDDAVAAAIRIINAGGGFTSVIDNAGTLISGAELNLLDGRDGALVDTNDAVATAITGTGVLASGSITSGFGSIDVGTDAISTSGTVTVGTLSVNGDNFTDLTGDGLAISSGALILASTTAGNGLTYSSGVLDVGAGTGITVNANDVAINQSASLTWTGTETFSPSGTNDVVVNTDSDSTIQITGLAAGTGSVLCVDGSNNVVTCTTSASPFTSAGGIIDKTTASDRMRLMYGDAADTQLTIENTTNSIIPTADVMALNISGGTTGIVTDGVDGLYINTEFGNGTTNTNSALRLDVDPVNTPSGDEVFYGLSIDGLSAGTAASESAIFIGANWDNVLNLNGTGLSSSELTLLDGLSGTVWTSNNDGAGSGLDADLLDGIDSGAFLRSDTSDNYTSGTLAIDAGTTLDVNGDLTVADTSIAFDGASTTFTTTAGLLNITGDVDISDQLALGNVGTITAGRVLFSDHSYTDTSGTQYGIYSLTQADAAGASTASNVAIYGESRQDTINGAATLRGVIGLANVNGAATVTNAQGIYGDANVANGVAATVTNLTGIRGTVDGEDATSVTNARTLHLNTPDLDTGTISSAYGIQIEQGTKGAGTMTTQYGVRISALNNGINNYGFWGDAGDWILDENGDGAAGGTTGGGDLIIGETQNLEFYHDGTNSNIVNNTGILNIAAASGSSITFTDGANTLASISDNGTNGILSTDIITLTGTGTLNGLDSIDGTGESTLEAAIDIAGDVTGTGLTAVQISSNVIDDNELVDALTYTGALTLTPGTTNDFVINTDSDSTIQLTGLSSSSGSVLCLDGSNNVVTCAAGSSSPFASSAGVITKVTASDRLALIYGDAADTQLTVENTTNAVIPSADTVSIDLTGGTAGIVTNGADAFSIAAEFGNGSGNTNSGLHIDIDPVNSPSGDELFYGINIDGITGTSATEAAIFVGANWDAVLSLNGTNLDATELGRLDGKDAALVDTNDAVATAITGTGALNSGSITSGFGAIDVGTDAISTSGTVTAGTLSVNSDSFTDLTGNGLAISSGALSLAASAAGNGLTYNTGVLDVGAGTGISVAADTVNVDQSFAFAWTGQHSFTTTVTDTGAIQDVNLTLGDDGATDTVSGINIDATSANTGEVDALRGINISTLTSPDGNVVESAIFIGTNWDAAINLNGTLVSSTELGLLDGRSGTLVDSANVGSFATTAVTAGGGLTGGGTTGALTLDIGAGTGITVNANDVAINQAANLTWTGIQTFSPSGTNDVVLNTDTDSTVQLTGLASASGTGLCIDGSNNIVTCTAGSSSATLQSAYDAGNTIAATNGRNIAVTLTDTASDPLFSVQTASGGAGYSYLSLADGSGAANAGQLLLMENLDTNITLANGVVVQAASGGAITDALDVSDAELANGINLGANFALFDGIRAFEGSTGTLTVEDTSGNDLATIVDNGTTGTLTVNTINAFAAGGNIDMNSNLVLNIGDAGTDFTAGGGLTIAGTLTANAATALSPGGTSDVTVTTDTDSTLILNGLASASGTGLCVDGSNNVVTCAAGSSSATLQSAYDAGNTIAATNARNIDFTLTDTGTDPLFSVQTASGGAGYSRLSLADGSGAANASQLLMVENLDTNLTLANGVVVQSVGGGAITDALDLSDGEIVNAINIGLNNIVTSSTTIDSTELDLLDGRSGTLVDSVNVATYATTGVTAGSGLSGGGTVGVSTLNIGGGTGITVNADDIAINQAANLTWTGIQTFSPSSTNDVIVNTDTDSVLQLNGLASGTGTILCIDGSNNVVSCSAAGSPFSSSGGIIDKAVAADRLRLLFGDAGDTQLTIENTTNSVIPTADAMAIDLTGGTTGTITDGADGLFISTEFGNGTTNTNSALHLDVNPVNTPSGDEIFYALNIDGLTAGTAAAESAIFVGANWDNVFDLNGTQLTATELGRLDGKDAALVDTNDAVSTAITGTGALNSGSITSGFGAIDVGTDAITTSGTVTAGTLTINSESFTDLTGNGLSNSSGILTLATTTAGAGLTYSTGVLNVGAGTGITVNTDDVAVNEATNFAWTGVHSFTNTITDSGSQLDFNLTLGDDGAADTISGINIDATSAATGDGDAVRGLNIADLTSAQAGNTESAIFIGANWDAALNLNGTLLSSTELGLLDGRSGTLVDSNNVATYATTGVTAGSGLTGGGTVGVLNLDIGAGTGITVNANDVAINQAANLTWTGIQTFSPSGTNDMVVNTDSDSNLQITGLTSASGSSLCIDGSNNVVTCAAGTTSPFSSSAGVITKVAASDRLALIYGDAGDTQLTIENTTNAIIPTVDSSVIDLSGGTTGIVTNGVDAFSIVAEFGNGTTNTNSGVHIDIDPVNTPSGDEIFYAMNIDGITGSSASESAIFVGSGWDNILDMNGTQLTSTELGRLDGKDAALVDTNDAVATAITGTGALNSGSITSGFGAIDVGTDAITTSGTVSAGTLAIGGDSFTDLTGNGLAISSGSLILASSAAGNGLTYSSGVLDVGAGTGISVAADAVAIDQTASLTWTGNEAFTPAAGNHGITVTASSNGTDAIYGESLNFTQGDDADATDTNAGLNIAMTSSSGDADTLNALRVANITGGTANEYAIRVGSGWDQVFDINGTLLSATEVGLLDGRSGTLVDSANVATYATTGVTAGSGLTGGGTVGVVTLDIGAGTGITVNANDVAINQAANLTWTGIQTFTPSGTNDMVINTDSDSVLQITGLSASTGSVLCVDGSNNVVTCTASASPFTSAGGIIDKSVATDRLRLLYGDAADTQLAIENTTNNVIPTVDAASIDLTGNTTGIVTDGVDGLFITTEFGNGTTNTNAALHLDVNPVNSPSGDEIFYGLSIEGITGTSATEYAINVGSGWDSVLRVNGTEVINSTGQVPAGQLTGTLFSITDSGTTETIAQGNTITFTDSSTINAAVSATDTVTHNVIANSLDFAHLENSLDVDAATDVNLGANALTIDLDSTGDFSIRDVTTDVATFADSGAITFAPTSGEDVTLNFAGNGRLDVNPVTYENNLGAVDVVRTGNFTGVAAETANDIRVVPSLTLTEPGSGVFTWNGANVDLSGVSVTAGAGTSALTALRVAGVSDADAGTVTGIDIANQTATAATENALTIGTGWDRDLNFADTSPTVAMADGGTLTVNDGTNTLLTLADAGTTGNLTITGTTTSTGLISANGGLTVASGQTLTANGQVTIAPNSTNDISITTDTDSFINIAGLTAGTGSVLCVDGSSNVVTCSASASPFTASGGIIDKSVATDRLRLLYGDAADTQLTIENTTNNVIPTVDAAAIDLTGNTTGIVTDGVDGLFITTEFGNGTTNTNAALHLDVNPVNSPSGDEIFYGVSIDGITGTSATEYALNVGSGWDSILRVNGTEVINGTGQVPTGQLTGTVFSVTDGGTTETIAQGNTVTFADSSTINAAVSATDTVTHNVIANSLDFAHLENTLDVDAATDVNLGANAFTIDLDSTGDFSIRDVATDIATFADNGSILFAPTSGQNLTMNFGGVGFLDINPVTYTNNTGAVDVTRSNNFTGTAAETANDLRVAPSLTLTEPGSGTFTWNGANIDMSGISVTAGAGTSTLAALRVAGVSDADAGSVYGLEVANLTSTAATEHALHIGTGWDDILNYNGTSVINGTGQVVAGQLTGTLFSITDGGTTETIAQGNTITYADSSTINAAVSATDTVTYNVIANSLDFAHLENSLDVDAATDINLGTNALTIDLDSSGDFSIRDVTTDIATFADNGAITFAPTTGLTNFTGDIDVSDQGAFGSASSVTAGRVLNIDNSFTDTSGNLYGGYFLSQSDAAGASTAVVYGVYGEARNDTAQTLTTLRGVTGGANVNAATTVTNAQGVLADASVANTVAATVTNLTGLRGTVDAEDATSVTTARSLHLTTADVDTGAITNAYGIHVDQGTKGAGSLTTQYGLRIAAMSNGGTNNYGFWGDAGDWILDEDGDGSAGGTTGGGDIVLGEDQDLEIYHNGTNAFVNNNTGSLFLTTVNGSAIVLEDASGNDLLSLTDAGAIALGSAAVGTTAITLATDGTGDAEVVLPTGSISTGEILDATILPVDLDLTTADSPADGDCLTYELSTTDFEWATCGGASAFTSAGGIIDKTTAADRLRLLYGDAGDTQLTIENTTNNVIPTIDAAVINLSGNTTGIVTDGVDGLYINTEFGNGTTNTNSALHLDVDPVNSPSGDEVFYGLNIDGLTASSATERAIGIGSGWDTALQIDSAVAFSGNLIDVNTTAAFSTNVIDITTGTSAASGNLIDLNFGAVLDTGDAINIALGGTAVGAQALVASNTASVRTASMIQVDDNNSTGTVATFDLNGAGTRGGLFDIDWSGALATEHLIDVTANSIATANLTNYTANGLTTGKIANLSSTSTVLTTGSLMALDWTPGGATTATGDLFKLTIGANGNVGNLFALYDDSTELFSVDESKITSALPHEFTATGDTSFAYDAVFTNQTSSKIESYGPFTLETGESFENNSLTLKTYGTGDIVLDTGGEITARDDIIISSSENDTTNIGGQGLLAYGAICADDSLDTADDCIDASRAAGSVQGISSSFAIDDIAENFPTMDPAIAAGDIVALDHQEIPLDITPDGAQVKYETEFVKKAVQGDSLMGVISKLPGVLLGGFGQNKDPRSVGEVAVVLSGRVPVRVALYPGTSDIKAGDYITASSISGVAKKASEAGIVLGMTLDNFNLDSCNTATGQTSECEWITQPDGTQVAVKPVMVFVNTMWYPGTLESSSILGAQNDINDIPSDLTIGGKLTAQSGLTVLGKTTLSDTAIVGSLSVGTLQLTSQSVNSLAGTLKLQDGYAAGDIDAFRGKILLTTQGNIKALGEVTARKFNVDNSAVVSASAGVATIGIGQTSIAIDTTALTDKSLIFATPDIPVAIGSKKIAVNKFEIKLSTPATSEIKINWWIVN
jgi:fibronectin-binding autotransporter adhesin